MAHSNFCGIAYNLSSQPSAILATSVIQSADSPDNPSHITTLETVVTQGSGTWTDAILITVESDTTIVYVKSYLVVNDEFLAEGHYPTAYVTDITYADYVALLDLIQNSYSLSELRDLLGQTQGEMIQLKEEIGDYLEEVEPLYSEQMLLEILGHIEIDATVAALSWLSHSAVISLAHIITTVSTYVFAAIIIVVYGWAALTGIGLIAEYGRLAAMEQVCYHKYREQGGELVHILSPNGGGHIYGGTILVSAEEPYMWSDVEYVHFQYSINSTNGVDGNWYDIGTVDEDSVGLWWIYWDTTVVPDGSHIWVRVRGIDPEGYIFAWDSSDSWFEVNQGGASGISILEPHIDPPSYLPGDTLHLDVYLGDNHSDPIAGATVTYTVGTYPQVYTMQDMGGGNYQDSSHMVQSPSGSRTIYVFARKAGYGSANMATAFSVYDPAEGHDLQLESASLSATAVAPDESVDIEVVVRNLTENDETRVDVHTLVTGPGGYSFEEDYYVGTVPGYSAWGPEIVSTWTAPTTEGYYVVWIEAVGLSGC